MPRMRSKKLPGLRNGRLRREGTSWTSKWTLETRSKWGTRFFLLISFKNIY
ncbi:hypothetical protein RhiirA1_472908 [Rhizophagus irregularis]|uniref:Uncharacterized protein n=1 Tax=Rhizophagus irregularis TaxID=588596 RepID=A0A2N0QNR6_9GLOM|nr:hypothetical protein RhiirA1_480912 [Rhizophagus irregularis]PKC57178.1 hypothetical protein RhiirA1_472908 [Rhizophagus irregularis]